MDEVCDLLDTLPPAGQQRLIDLEKAGKKRAGIVKGTVARHLEHG